MRKQLILACAALLSACISLNEGEVSYRRADPPSGVDRTHYAERHGANMPPVRGQEDGVEHGQPTLPARLIRQNISLADAGFSARPFLPGDQISIRLDYGFIDGSMSELPFAPDRLETFNNPFIRRGEIVILANAFEFPEAQAVAPPAAGAPDDRAQTENEPRFYFDNASLQNARVIFYSNDVQSQQGLNFSNIPLLGPVEYHGRPIGIQLIILELDQTSPEMEGLLTNLAEIGKSSAGINGPLADALFALGASLLSTGTDDTLMRFTLVLDPEARARSASRIAAEVSLLEEGRLVFFRREDRGAPVNWESLRLDHNDGRLYASAPRSHCRDTAPCYEIFTGETYLTLNVINAGPTDNNATFNYQTWGALRAAVTQDNADSDAIVERLRTDAQTYRAGQRMRRLRDQWRRVSETYISEYAPLIRTDALPTCERDPSDIAARRNRALLHARSEAQLFWTEMKDVFDDEGVSSDSKTLLLTSIGDYALAADQANGFTIDELAIDSFTTTFLNPPVPAAFVARLDAAATARAPTTCPSPS